MTGGARPRQNGGSHGEETTRRRRSRVAVSGARDGTRRREGVRGGAVGRDRRGAARRMAEVSRRDAASPGSAALGVRRARPRSRREDAWPRGRGGARQGARRSDRVRARRRQSARRADRRGGVRRARGDEGSPELGADRARGGRAVRRRGARAEGRARRSRARRGPSPVSHARLDARAVDGFDGLQGGAAAARRGAQGRHGDRRGARRARARPDGEVTRAAGDARA
ncbi:hypothetical protein BMAA1969 [Burkholderia mallei ATCC 23344]|uniref:Uncharacterized protein n=1 Tax=Burkholderia mallei (strain ATCC 23344) TaxID=243160 RepID=A0A0H2W9W5_BURMA|nr:hypothetical protein BMAA1969 [Burkholderia mallei ATCC 23344]